MRFFKKYKLLTPVFLLTVALPACLGGGSGPRPATVGKEVTCHDFDLSQSLHFNFKQAGIKRYILVKKGAQMTAAKIREGESYGIPNRSEADAYTSGVSRIRKVGQSEPPTVHDIFWLDESYKRENTEDFIFAFQEILADGNYLFDIYGDSDKFHSVSDLPEYIQECNLEGGGNLVPIDDPGTEFPPVVIGIGDIDKTGYELNFDKYVDEYTEKYTHDHIAPPVSIPTEAEQIGVILLKEGGADKPHDVFYHAGSMFLKDQSDANRVYQYSSVVGEVTLPAGAEPELQLSTLKFITPFVWSWWVPECKPAIYFYPEEKTELTVTVDPYGTITQSYPPYGDGWQITAYPDGRLFHDGAYYKHLDYEAELIKVKQPTEGYVVARDELDLLFTQLLPLLGLNEAEIADFKEYWLKRLTLSPYYAVSLLSQEEIERVEPLSLSVTPDSFIRIRFYFKGLDAPIVLTPPVIDKTSVRKGFTVVEWGGVVDDGGLCQ